MPVRQATYDAEVGRLLHKVDDAKRDVTTLTNLNTRQAQKITELKAVLLETHHAREEACEQRDAFRGQVDTLKAELTAERMRTADLTAENTALASQLEAALAAVSVKYDGSEWADGSTTVTEELRRAKEQITALERRVAVLQAANEALDTHRNGQPWIGEQQRAVAP
jgi:chromosome segregation ATPase